MALLISLAIAISYLDRQTLSVAIAAIQLEIPITNTQFSQLQAAFLLAYAVMYAGGGRLIDALGTRRGFLLIMVWWSLACASHSLAAGFVTLAASRFLLGMGEGGGFPAATKAVAEWFPTRERSTAMGIINAGTAIGAVVAPPAIAAVIAIANWRWVFSLCGAAGLLWTLWWLRDYFPPAQHARLSEAERAEIKEVFVPPGKQEPRESWLRLFTFPQVWGLVLGKFLSDAAWYFYLFWLPKYLYDMRGFDTKQVGYFAWIPYAASGLGSLTGGWLSSRLLRRGHSLNFSRKAVLGASAAVMPLILFVTRVPVEMTIVLFSIAFFGQQSWSTLVMILPADLFPGRVVGSVAGLVGFGGAMGGVVFNLVAGRMLDSGLGYGSVFALVSTFHVLAFALILLTIRSVNPLDFKGATQ
ncbi:MAG TPA: MFS transporter [Blastocatellia bacterium]|nr:MFS transporter [Blastocatellia bacterium]